MTIPTALAASLTQKQPLLITEGITGRQLSKILKEAAAEAEAMIASNLAQGTFSSRVSAAQLRQAVAGVGQLSSELWTGVGQITQAGMYQQAQLAADQALDLDLILGMPAMATLQYANALHFEAAQAVEDILSRRTEGFKLSESIYKYGKQGVTDVGRIVEKNLALQRSAKDIANAVKGYFDPKVPGGASYAAMRVGRTEINNAHHTTTKRLAQEKPWVIAMKWHLSSSHPKPDICNDYASQDHDDMGPGVFEIGNVPGKPHPHCYCYLTHVQLDEKEFMKRLTNGEYDEWLSKHGVSC